MGAANALTPAAQSIQNLQTYLLPPVFKLVVWNRYLYNDIALVRVFIAVIKTLTKATF